MTMTDERMALIELIEKGADADLVRDLLAFAADRMMELEVEAKTGVPAGARSPDRQTHRNGYRERGWDTRAGRIDLAIPKLRKGSHGREGAHGRDPGGLCAWDLDPSCRRSRSPRWRFVDDAWLSSRASRLRPCH